MDYVIVGVVCFLFGVLFWRMQMDENKAYRSGYGNGFKAGTRIANSVNNYFKNRRNNHDQKHNH